jgi:hypothetical protein
LRTRWEGGGPGGREAAQVGGPGLAGLRVKDIKGAHQVGGVPVQAMDVRRVRPAPLAAVARLLEPPPERTTPRRRRILVGRLLREPRGRCILVRSMRLLEEGLSWALLDLSACWRAIFVCPVERIACAVHC